jgi:hypothetical protein
LVASKAYEFINSELYSTGLYINTPKTIYDVEKPLIPLWVNTLGGFAVIKNPYSNAGQGVWTITTTSELEAFMELKYDYEQFIVQSLIGNNKWSSTTQSGQFYHVGTVPDKLGDIYVADLRMMIHYDYNKGGYSPLALYARKSLSPLTDTPPTDSWSVLGTNLSYKKTDGTWGSDTKRLIVVAQETFSKLGLGVDDLINAYIQTVLGSYAIDKLAGKLIEKGKFNLTIFKSLNKDTTLMDEFMLNKDEDIIYDEYNKKEDNEIKKIEDKKE